VVSIPRRILTELITLFVVSKHNCDNNLPKNSSFVVLSEFVFSKKENL